MPTTGDRPETLASLRRRGRELLRASAAEGDSPLEADLLLEKALGLPRGALLARGQEPAPREGAERFLRLAERRARGEPLQYLLGEWEFLGLPFEVGPGVLIPRPETELLAETALKLLRGVPSPALLDLCSGSGCIPIALGVSRPDARVWGVELSPAALGFFRRNIGRNGAANVTAVEGDVFALPGEIAGRRYRLITANPPYIPRGELGDLQREVQAEPSMALDGGEDGLDFYRLLPGLCLPLLEPGGALLLEIGEDQGEAVRALLLEAGYRNVEVLRDFAGLDRVVLGFS